MAFEPNETNPLVTCVQGRQRMQDIGGGRSIINQQKLPIVVNLPQHGLHSLAEPRNRSVEYRGEYADERSRSESVHLMAHRGQLPGTRAMLLEPPLVFAWFTKSWARPPLPTEHFPDCFRQFFESPIRREQHLTHPTLRGLAQTSPLFFQQLQFTPVLLQFK